MPVINLVDRNGDLHVVEAADGMSVMEIVRGSGKGDIVALCGGMKSCATCHVYVADQWLSILSAADEDENDLLDSSDGRQTNSRLCCQIEMSAALDGLHITIAPEQ